MKSIRAFAAMMSSLEYHTTAGLTSRRDGATNAKRRRIVSVDMRHKRIMKDVARLRLHPKNPRQIAPQAFEALKASLEKFGLYRAPVWNRRFKHIVAGNQTVRALHELGVKKVEVIVVDLDEADDVALLLNDNNRFAQGQYTADVHDLAADISDEDLAALRLDTLVRFEAPPEARTEVDIKEKDLQVNDEPTNRCPRCHYEW